MLLLSIFSCRFPKFEKPSEDTSDIPSEAIVFYAIDNEVTVWVNGEQVYQNGTLLSASDPKVIFELKDHLKRGNNVVDVKLKDKPNDRCLVNTWTVAYDIYVNGKILDYWSESKPANDVCQEEYKVERTHEIQF